MDYSSKVITVVIDAELLKTIDQQAEWKRMARSEYIRTTIRQCLENDYEKHS